RAAPRPAAPAAVAPSAPARTAAPAPAAQPAGPPSPSFLRALAAALERYKRYPEAARSRRAEGVVLLRFTLHRSGSVLNWAIARSAGDADLDRAVGEMIERARLPGMPTDMPGDSLTITVPVRFQIR
ncbi:energy transducer TonB, partial [Roseomonas sp. HJA6]